MKNTYFFIIIISLITFAGINQSSAQSGEELVNICSRVAGDATYLKDFTVKLGSTPPGQEPLQDKQSLVLRKNTVYKFSICSSKDYAGRAILKLFSSSKLEASNYMVATGKIYPSFEFTCQKTGAYHIFVEFEDGKEGLAVVILSFVKKI
jgi:hypothetical protein